MYNLSFENDFIFYSVSTQTPQITCSCVHPVPPAGCTWRLEPPRTTMAGPVAAVLGFDHVWRMGPGTRLWETSINGILYRREWLGCWRIQNQVIITAFQAFNVQAWPSPILCFLLPFLQDYNFCVAHISFPDTEGQQLCLLPTLSWVSEDCLLVQDDCLLQEILVDLGLSLPPSNPTFSH